MAERQLPNVIALGDIRGDLSAPPGSEPWALAVKFELQQHLRDHKSNASELESWWKLFVEHKGWSALRDGLRRPYASLQAFCIAPFPWGLEYSFELIDGVIHERKTAQAVAGKASPIGGPGGDRRSEGFQVDNINLKLNGTDPNYLAARIARDRPDIHEKMKAGAYRSVRQAALEAGIVKPTFTCPADPDAAARTIKRHFDTEQRLRLIELLQQG